MPVEKERKYLVQSSGWRARARRGERLRQGYLSTDPDRSVRVRVGENKAVITIKAPTGDGSALERSEYEYPIPLDDANQLLDQVCRHPVIEKTRFRLPENGRVWEIDQFENLNQGLVLAELETENGATPKHLPRWIGEDVSHDSRFENANLVEHPYSEWRARSPKPDQKYHWKSDEGVAKGLERIVSEQLELAIWQLSENASSLDDAVHETRKSLKKIRSAIRLLRGQLGPAFDKYYDQENGTLRDVGRKLSALRDAQGLIEMFDKLNAKYRHELGDGGLLGVRDGLVAHKERLRQEFEHSRTRGKALKGLRDSSARVAKWRLKSGSFQAISDGFARTMRRNLKTYREACRRSSPENFHKWRKRAKDLRYQFGLIGKAWPPVLEGYQEAVKDLEQRLGDDHNLVVLRNTILQRPDDFGKEEDIKALIDIVDQHQKKLREECKALAHRLYADKPAEWRKRLDRCWKSLKDVGA